MLNKLTVIALAAVCVLTAGCGVVKLPFRGAATVSSPGDLLAHLDYPRGGVGSGMSAQVDRNVLPEHTIDVTLAQGYMSAYSMNADREHPQIVVGSDILINGQHYEPGDQISTEFVASDGTTSTQQVTVDEGGFWTELWRLLPHSPLGTYTVKFTSRSGTESISFAVTQPDTPFIRVVCGSGQFDVHLFGFKPDEPVQLGLYGGENLGRQTTWGVSAGSDGSVSTSAPNADQSFGMVVALADEEDDRPVELTDPIDGGLMKVTAVDVANCQ